MIYMRNLIFLLLLSSSFFSYAEKKIFDEKLYIAKGACPFECCTYRNWNAKRNVSLLKEPNKNSAQVGIVQQGLEVQALTGEIHIIPSKFIFTKSHWSGYQAGNVIWILHNAGEGEYKIWNGVKESHAVFFAPGDGNSLQCDLEWHPINCSGNLKRPLKSEWWVKIQLPTGVVGWTNQSTAFGNKDSCG